MLKRRIATLLLIVVAAMSVPAWAALQPGTKAPMFTAEATLAGKRFTFSLEDALKSGPVVVYFYPQAFTAGCTVEAHEFAEAMDEFKALGAQVIGVSGDDLETLDKFSTLECGGKFPVASDEDKQIMSAYDSVMMGVLPYANRTSYVVAPDGTVAYEYTALSPHDHVKNTLAAIKALKPKPAGAAGP
jgi:peroxiredoxin